MSIPEQKKIAFIPLRGSSKSIKGKNIKLFCGKPLAYWVVDAAEKSNVIDEIVVATEDERIKKAILSWPQKKTRVYNRSIENAQDYSSTESVMLEYIMAGGLKADDLMILIQATSPFTTDKDIDSAVSLIQEKKADSLLSCARIKKFIWNEGGTPLNYDYMKRPLRQCFQGQLVENGAIYINTVSNILKYRNRLSGNICIYEMPDYTSIELDEELDWVMAEAVMRKQILYTSGSDKKIRLVLTDVDGVLTDAGMYYADSGEELKKFNTLDGKAFELLRNAGIKTGILTSESTKIVKNRALKVKADFVRQGITDKLETAKEICNQLKIKLSEVAYIGDDINDLELLNSAGISFCPVSAVDRVKEIRHIIILNKAGGHGAFREMAEQVLKRNDLTER